MPTVYTVAADSSMSRISITSLKLWVLQFVAAVTYDYQRFLVAAPRFEMREREGRIVKGRSAFGSIFRKGRAQQVKVVREGHGFRQPSQTLSLKLTTKIWSLGLLASMKAIPAAIRLERLVPRLPLSSMTGTTTTGSSTMEKVVIF